MKKSILILIFLAFAACKKDGQLVKPGDMCVECVEHNTGIDATYCGDPASCKVFRDQLENDGYPETNWSCKYVNP